MNKNQIASFQKKLLGWYNDNKRDLPWRISKDPYHVWVSEVMLQQTQVVTVINYFHRFIKKFPDIRSLARADLQDVLKCWEGLGYYSRARNFHKSAILLAGENRKDIPSTPEEFIQFPGVGEYINSAVQSIAFGHPLAVADGNVKRVVSRLFLMEAPVNKSGSHALFKKTAQDLLDTNNPGDFNQAMMELGAVICKPRKPICSDCSVQQFCKAYLKQLTTHYPRRVKPRKVPIKHLAAGVVVRNRKILITRRESEGFLGGMWEFPGYTVKNKEAPESACIRAIKDQTNLNVLIDTKLTTVKHAYTHFKLNMNLFLCRFVSGRIRLNGPEDYRWISPKSINNFPFHKAVHKSFPSVLSALEI